MLHIITAIILWCRERWILIGKTDPYESYLWVQKSSQSASSWISVAYIILVLCLRLTFGTTKSLSQYTTISEVIIRLSNNLLQEPTCESKHLQFPNVKSIPPDHLLEYDISLGKFHNLEVYPQAKGKSFDGFVYELITLSIDYKYWLEHAYNSDLLITHAMFRP